MNVLIATPVFQLYSHTVASALQQQWLENAQIDYLLLSGDDMRLNSQERITAKFNRISETFLQGDYAALLIVEADMIVPAHALAALWETGADVAYGLYCFRHSEQSGAWNVYLDMEWQGVGKALWTDPDAARRAWGKVIRCAGVGTGCTLIRRNVMEALSFRYEGMTHHDWAFALDCGRLGFQQAAHLGVACGHIRDRNAVLWPDISAPFLHRIEALP